MAALVKLDQAKLRLRLTEADDYHEPDVKMKMEQASDIVIDYIKRSDHEWTDEDTPPVVQAAILEVVRNLFEGVDPMPQPVKDLLWRFRDPALA